MNIPEKIVEKLLAAEHVVVFTGAGVSAESGIPTFRDAMTGLWENFDAEALASGHAFEREPSLVWGWYEWRRMKVLRARPNPAHLAIAALSGMVPRLTLVTQNVDDLHERAGVAEVIHLHGRLHSPRCFSCARPYEYPPGIPDEPEGGRRIEPPGCGCGGKIRPGVVWFGERLPDAEWEAACDAAGRCDVFLCVGTSFLVHPAATLPHLALRRGAMIMQVNQNPTSLDELASLNFQGAAGEVLPQLLRKVWGRSQ